MSKSELEKEWLFGNSVIALIGMFILGTAWRPSSDQDIVFISIGALLFFSALLFGLTSVVPVLRSKASRLAIYLSPVLKFLAFLGFTASWFSAAVELPEDQWWTVPLMYGGIVLLLIILLKMFQEFYRWSSRDWFDSSESAEVETPEEERRSGGLLLGGIIMAALILISVSRPALLRLWRQRTSSR